MPEDDELNLDDLEEGEIVNEGAMEDDLEEAYQKRTLSPEEKEKLAKKRYDDEEYESRLSTIARFIDRAGAVPIIHHLGMENEGLTWSEITELVENSTSTISDRLEEGAKLGLIKSIGTAVPGENDTYRLTDDGEVLRARLSEAGVLTTTGRLREVERELENKKESAKNKIRSDFYATNDESNRNDS